MPVRVLVVDDSAFFRRRIVEILQQDNHIEVIGQATDGKDAIEQVARLKPDVITMDIEMPVMDGITAVKQIMALHPTPILMFSSLTTHGAKPTLDALEAGAVDFLPKNIDDISKDRETARRQLCARVRLVGARGLSTRTAATNKQQHALPASTPSTYSAKPGARKGDYKLVAIGTSTGGPVALQQVLTQLPADFPLPILLVQHMPSTFTPAFAERLDKLSAIKVKEAEDGDSLVAGTAYLAPGGRQMIIDTQRGLPVIRIVESEVGQTYKPCVDITFESAAIAFGRNVLAVIMTGMGSDGREGARTLKQGGATVWSQDEESSVIYGMPAAVADAGLTDMVISLNNIAATLVEHV